MTHERYNSSERCSKTGTLLGAVALSVASLIAADFAANQRTQRGKSDKPEILSSIRSGETSTLVVPGYHSDGHILAKNFDRHIEHLGTTHYAVHPQKGLRLDAYKEEILKARHEDGRRPVNVYALSMGALLFAKMIEDDEFRAEFGPIKRLIIDSGLSGRGDLSPVSRLGILAGTLLPVTFSTDQIYHVVNQIGLGDEHLDYDPELVLKEEAIERITSTRKVRYAAAKGQLPFMHREDASRMNLAGAGADIEEGIIFLSSLKDHLIDTRRSVEVYSQSYDQPIEFRYDLNRKENSHASGPEHPRGVVDALEGKNRDKYLATDIRAMIAKYHETKDKQQQQTEAA